MPENDLYVDESGTRVRISKARMKRYPKLADAFRPMSEKKKAAPVAETNEKKEN